jgi:hypothetical protein
MQDGALWRQQHAYHGEDDDNDDDTPPYGVVEWYGGPFITTANHNLSVNDDYEHTEGVIPDEDWRKHEDDRDGAQWEAEAARKKKGEEGGWREVVAFYRSAEAWRKPNLMYIFFSFFLYMLAFSYSSAMIPLVRALSIYFYFYSHFFHKLFVILNKTYLFYLIMVCDRW